MAEKSQLLAELNTLLEQVPPKVVNGTWNQAVHYKNWVVKTRQVVNGKKANEALLSSLINQYNSF